MSWPELLLRVAQKTGLSNLRFLAWSWTFSEPIRRAERRCIKFYLKKFFLKFKKVRFFGPLCIININIYLFVIKQGTELGFVREGVGIFFGCYDISGKYIGINKLATSRY